MTLFEDFVTVVVTVVYTQMCFEQRDPCPLQWFWRCKSTSWKFWQARSLRMLRAICLSAQSAKCAAQFRKRTCAIC